MRARRALFLSGSFGKGHDTLAEACADALGPFGIESTILDCMPLLGRGAGIGDRVFRAMLAAPPLYDAYHFSQLRSDGRLGRLSEGAAMKALVPNLRRQMADLRPDLVVSVFATGAGGASALKPELPGVLTVVFMTDSYAHRLWVHAGTDLFLVTSELAAASVRRYEPSALVRVLAAPVRSQFVHPPTREDARVSLEVGLDARCVLVMSGGWGIGPVAEIARALGQAGFVVLAVAGNNEALGRSLRSVARQVPTVVPFGYVDDVAQLMAAADVVVTSSGDTCREVRAIGRPMVLLDVVPGHGRENLMHEVEMGNAAIALPTPRSVVGMVEWTLAHQAGARARAVTGDRAVAAADWSGDFVEALRGAGAEL